MYREAFPRERWVVLAVNGRSWPHTERLSHVVGDTIRWRVINGSRFPHPMHLHGFYFDVDARGDARLDTLYHRGAEKDSGHGVDGGSARRWP